MDTETFVVSESYVINNITVDKAIGEVGMAHRAKCVYIEMVKDATSST